MKKKLKGTVAHHQREVEELRTDRKLAVAYMKTAMGELDDPENRAAGQPGYWRYALLPKLTADLQQWLRKPGSPARRCIARYRPMETQRFELYSQY